jgi:hypothetical protein
VKTDSVPIEAFVMHVDPDVPRPRRAAPTRQDAIFRFAAAWFAVWVVGCVATSPVGTLRPLWWPAFLVLGALIAAAMLVGACMTMNEYLRNR